MTRTLFPLTAPDISAFAKTLKASLDERHAQGKAPPGHLELLNLLARAAGLRNFATLRAGLAATPAPAATSSPAPAAPAQAPATLCAAGKKALMQFDAQKRLVRLPNKLSVQRMAMWALWTRFAADARYTEKEVNAILNAHHTFGDQATLRRELVNMHLLGRKSDCSMYWKEAQPQPAPEVLAFLQAWQATPVH